MTRSYDDYIARARSLMSGGFGTKQAQKDALELVGRAFGLVRDEIQSKLLEVDHDRRDQAWRDKYYGLPMYLHEWRGIKMDALLPEFGAQRKLILDAFLLRILIKEIPVVKKAPQRTAKQLAEDAKARTCQICGRPIFAETGVIAHHGYKRPGDGWQTASCIGARELPFEVAKDRLQGHIVAMHTMLKNMRADRKAHAAEQTPVRRSYEVDRLENGKPVYSRGRRLKDLVLFEVTRDTFAAVKAQHPDFFRYSTATFDDLLKADLVRHDTLIQQQVEYIQWQQGREAAWKQLERWNAGTSKWEAA